MEQNKDQGGAAVRGALLADAKSCLEWLGEEALPGNHPPGVEDMMNRVRAAFVSGSARAADAPYEPSEKSRKFIDNVGYREEVWRDAQSRDPKYRAADALGSQPSSDEPTEREALIACLGDDAVTLLRLNPDDEMAQTMREAAAMLENDGKALDSQPTDDKLDDLIARLRHQVDELNGRLFDLQTSGQPTIRPTTKQLIAQLHDDQKWTIAEQNAVAEFLTRFPNESSQGIISLGDAWKHGQEFGKAQASSQPTDGGVRNGRDLKAVHAFLMGESPLEGVQFGDKHPTKAGAFWWRLNLRAALAKA